MFYQFYVQHLFIRKDRKVININPYHILFIEADRNLVRIVTTQGKHLVAATMQGMEERLQYDFLCRVHRSYIVNLIHIRYIDKNVINLGDTDVPIQKSYSVAFWKSVDVIN